MKRYSTITAAIVAIAVTLFAFGCSEGPTAPPADPPAPWGIAGPLFDSYPLVADSIITTATPFADCESVLVDVDVYLGYSTLMISAFYSLTATPGSCGPYPNGVADWTPESMGGGHWALEFRMPASYFAGLEPPDDVVFAWCGQLVYYDDIGDYYFDLGVWVDEPFCTPAGGGGGGGKGGPKPGQE